MNEHHVIPWRHTREMPSRGAFQCTTWLVWNKLAASNTLPWRRQENSWVFWSTGKSSSSRNIFLEHGNSRTGIKYQRQWCLFLARRKLKLTRWSGARQQEPTTTLYSCHGVFTDRSIFSFNLSRNQIATGTSVTNCNYKHGLMLAFRHNADMFTLGCIVLSLPKRVHVDWNWPISREKISKNRLVDWFVKMPLDWVIMGVEGS